MMKFVLGSRPESYHHYQLVPLAMILHASTVLPMSSIIPSVQQRPPSRGWISSHPHSTDVVLFMAIRLGLGFAGMSEMSPVLTIGKNVVAGIVAVVVK